MIDSAPSSGHHSARSPAAYDGRAFANLNHVCAMNEAEPLIPKRPRPVNALKHGHTVGHSLLGEPVTPEYAAWCGIKARCGNPKDPGFKNYGGRGIRVCPEWLESFDAFLRHVGRRPSPDHSLDRYPNNNGNYEPGNVRWVTWSEQCRNRRTCVKITRNGETKTMTEWAEVCGISASTVQARLKNGWDTETALTRPVGQRIVSDATRAKLSAWVRTPEMRAKMRASQLAKNERNRQCKR